MLSKTQDNAIKNYINCIPFLYFSSLLSYLTCFHYADDWRQNLEIQVAVSYNKGSCMVGEAVS